MIGSRWCACVFSSRDTLDENSQFCVSRSECYKTVLILETPFWVAGAVESMKIDRIVIGASNKSGRHLCVDGHLSPQFHQIQVQPNPARR